MPRSSLRGTPAESCGSGVRLRICPYRSARGNERGLRSSRGELPLSKTAGSAPPVREKTSLRSPAEKEDEGRRRERGASGGLGRVILLPPPHEVRIPGTRRGRGIPTFSLEQVSRSTAISITCGDGISYAEALNRAHDGISLGALGI